MVQFRSGAVAMLALLAWGCQESSGPVGPEGPGVLLNKTGMTHHHGGGGGGSDDGPGSERQVSIIGGLETIIDQTETVRVNSDNKKKFVIGAPAFKGAINLTGTKGGPNDEHKDCVCSAGDCATSSSELFLLLEDGNKPREFLMFFDRSDEAGFNQIQYKWDDGQLRLFIGRVPNKGVRLDVTVAKEDPEGTFTFSAGEVRLFSGFGDQSSDIRCILKDEVILEVT